MKGDLLNIILWIIIPFTGIFIGYKTKNMGRDEKFKRGRPSCLDGDAPGKGKPVAKCSFCHQPAAQRFPPDSGMDLKDMSFCSPECKEEIAAYMAEEKKNTLLFLGLLLGAVFLMIALSGVALSYNPRYGLYTIFITLAFIGAVLIKFPYCNPMTIQMLGIKRSKIFARCTGLVFIGLALVAMLKELI